MDSATWSIHLMECYVATKRSEALTHAAMWTNLENMILKERSQAQRATEYVILFI